MFRGLVLRGATPARDALLAALIADVSDRLPCRRMPGHIDDERLLGGIDIAASLAAGKPVETRGLLAEAEGGVEEIQAPEDADAAEQQEDEDGQAQDGDEWPVDSVSVVDPPRRSPRFTLPKPALMKKKKEEDWMAL